MVCVWKGGVSKCSALIMVCLLLYQRETQSPFPSPFTHTHTSGIPGEVPNTSMQLLDPSLLLLLAAAGHNRGRLDVNTQARTDAECTKQPR